jgi:hypothetical protein
MLKIYNRWMDGLGWMDGLMGGWVNDLWVRYPASLLKVHESTNVSD